MFDKLIKARVIAPIAYESTGLSIARSCSICLSLHSYRLFVEMQDGSLLGTRVDMLCRNTILL